TIFGTVAPGIVFLLSGKVLAWSLTSSLSIGCDDWRSGKDFAHHKPMGQQVRRGDCETSGDPWRNPYSSDGRIDGQTCAEGTCRVYLDRVDDRGGDHRDPGGRRDPELHAIPGQGQAGGGQARAWRYLAESAALQFIKQRVVRRDQRH